MFTIHSTYIINLAKTWPLCLLRNTAATINKDQMTYSGKWTKRISAVMLLYSFMRLRSVDWNCTMWKSKMLKTITGICKIQI